MAYQDALALYNAGNTEEALEELKKCEPSPLVEGLKKECERQIEEKYNYLIMQALKVSPNNIKAVNLYDQYSSKYGPNERLKELLPKKSEVTSTSSQISSNQVSKPSNLPVALAIAAILILGCVVFFMTKSSGDTERGTTSGAISLFNKNEEAEEIAEEAEEVAEEAIPIPEETFMIYHHGGLVPLDESCITGKVVVDKDGEVLGNYGGEDADNYIIETDDSYTASKRGLHVETYSARDGQGEIILRGNHKASVYRTPDTSDFLCTIEDEEGMMPDGYKCLGYNNGWFHIKLFDGRNGYVESSQVEWYTIWW
ncbi:MAG: hypothetical protein MJZ73_03345 [Bacteroidaceae bacterium]|nr:hypothetical protein [Bacteroidaceae bacterium]